MRILGHRGASADAPENTLPALLLALAQGADGVEFDVQLCASGEVVVFHDASLERLAGRPGRVVDTPWSTLRTLDVGSPGGRAPASIPLLTEVLEALPRTAWLNIELKADGGGLHLAATVARLLARQDTERVVISSFQPLCLLAFAARAPGVRRGYLLDPAWPFWLEAGLIAPLVGRDAIHPGDAQVSEERVRAWHRSGREVAVWTVDAAERARTLERWGVDTLITNRPGRLRTELSGQR
jgi:glycerophosphoryl diester phosphodiesterase